MARPFGSDSTLENCNFDWSAVDDDDDDDD